MQVRLYQQNDHAAWDAYVHAHPASTLYHLSAWRDVISKTYKHNSYYLMVMKGDSEITGILPLVHLRNWLFGNNLISLPFFDHGGVLADDQEAERALLIEAVHLSEKLKVETIELRHARPLASLALEEPRAYCSLKLSRMEHELGAVGCVTKTHKVRMLLKLPDSSKVLMKSFKSKLRSQIRKAVKEELNAKIGGIELLDHFYSVFCVNMRDLGSPVHSKKLIRNVIKAFVEKAKIIVVYNKEEPIASSLIVGFKDTVQNPWASALRKYSRLAPNMLLYWTMLEYACDNGYKMFDFGRSTPGEGTYKFKEQWGSTPVPLYWHCLSLNGVPMENVDLEKSKFDKAIHYWQKVPVPVTKIVGPMIRKHISL